jgi:hypothetical protein
MEELVKKTVLSENELCDVTGGAPIDLPDWANLPTARPYASDVTPFQDRPLPWFPSENYKPKH